MKHLKSQSLFVILLALQQSWCQQSSQQYGQQQSSQQYQQNQNKVQLEDIERDNLKSSQHQSISQPSQSQQYVPYTQDQLVYSIQPQQAALFSSAQQPVGTQSLYASQPTATMIISPQQQQQLLIQPYYSQAQQPYPYIDFGGFPLYPGLYPYIMSQNTQQSAGQVPPSIVNDYYKTIQPSASSVKSAPVSSPVKSVSPTQVPAISNYLLSNAIPNAYYQPVSFTQPQQTSQQYYPYNSYYQVQNQQKSVYSAGIKSTTPSIPVKGKDEPFVPVTNGNYRFEYPSSEQNSYSNKVRLSG